MKNYPKIITLVSSIFCSVSALASSGTSHYIMIDAGSSKSRVNVCYLQHNDGKTVQCDEVFKTKDGLHHHKIYGSKLIRHKEKHHYFAVHAKKLIQSAFDAYKSAGHSLESLSGFHMYATAGMRSLGKKETDAMDSLAKDIFTRYINTHHSTLNVPVEVKTLEGHEEAAYAWLSINAGKDEENFHDINEMGGYSMQYAHLLNGNDLRQPDITLEYNNVSYPLIAKSYFLGADKALNRVRRKDKNQVCAFNDVAKEQQFDKCVELTKSYVGKQKVKPEELSENPMILMGGGYKYTLKQFGIYKTSDLTAGSFKQQIKDKGSEVCSLSWNEYLASQGMSIDNKYAKYHKNYCFNLAHYYAILEYGFQLPENSPIDNHFDTEASWLKGIFLSKFFQK